MNTVLSLIIMLSYTSLKKDINYTISKFIIGNVDRIHKMTIRQIASECYTSTTSVLKFCHLLGFENYTMFKSHLVNTVKIRKRQIEERYQHFDEDELLELIKTTGYNSHFSYENLKNQLEALLNIILQASHIVIIGASFPLALTQAFQEDLIIMGKSVMVSQLQSDNYEFDENTCCLVITFTGRYLYNYREEYKKFIHSPAKVCVISQNAHDFLDADLCVEMPIKEDNEFNDVHLLYMLDYIKYRFYQTGFQK